MCPLTEKRSVNARSHRIGLALIVVLLSACTTSPVSSPEAMHAWGVRQTKLAQLTTWQAEGRIGVIHGQDGWHARFQWVQQPSAWRIDLIGPLGQGRVLVESDAQGARVQTQDGQKWTALDADELLEQSLGLRLPVNGLRYWVRGLPEPGSAPVLNLDASGRLIRLEQNGWVIEYPAYTPSAIVGLDLPERMMARRTDLNVKLVIEQWQP